MTQEDPFKWKHFQEEVILLCVRWYLRYSLSYRDLEEMMMERRIKVDYTTIYSWIIELAPEINKRSRLYLKPTNDSWKVNKTYIIKLISKSKESGIIFTERLTVKKIL